jgi:hypothetical protein
MCCIIGIGTKYDPLLPPLSLSLKPLPDFIILASWVMTPYLYQVAV